MKSKVNTHKLYDTIEHEHFDYIDNKPLWLMLVETRKGQFYFEAEQDDNAIRTLFADVCIPFGEFREPTFYSKEEAVKRKEEIILLWTVTNEMFNHISYLCTLMYCANWIESMVYQSWSFILDPSLLWDETKDSFTPSDYTLKEAKEIVQSLKECSEKINGWILVDEKCLPTFIEMPKWLESYATYDSKTL